MSEEALRRPRTLEDAPLPGPPVRRIVLDMPSWVPVERIPRRVLVAVATVLVLLVLVVSAIPLLTDWVSEDDFRRYGYAGIFLANFLANATAFVPVPGLSAIGQALVVKGAERLWDPGVVVAAASAMTLAESTAYGLGALGRGIIEEHETPIRGRLGRFMQHAARWVDWLMARYGFPTLLVLSAIPNPFFEFAGITAGAVRMNFLRFLVAVGIGKTVRVILLVTLGEAVFDWFGV